MQGNWNCRPEQGRNSTRIKISQLPPRLRSTHSKYTCGKRIRMFAAPKLNFGPFYKYDGMALNLLDLTSNGPLSPV
eukprot:evm.model.NODE_19262_length_43251_cov_28.561583.6